MKIEEFGVELWMNEFENHCEHNLAETCVVSITLEQLVEYSGRTESEVSADLMAMRLTYGAIEGSERLRNNISELYKKQTSANVIVSHGTIGANSLVFQTLVEPDDHVICVKPTYQQLYSIPESYGARVSSLQLREEHQFLPDLAEMKSLVKSDTRLITINNPNNPTGALMDEAMLLEIVDIAASCDAYLLCDEVYRGTDQHGSGSTVSVVDLYDKGISTGGFSKAFSLAGLRVGWVVAPETVIRAVAHQRDYNTISVGMINDYFACMALESRDKILARSRDITRTNLKILDDWVDNESSISYVKPGASTVALLKYHFDKPSRDFCTQLLDAKGVLFTPGSAFNMEGYVRIGFANSTQDLEAGLPKVSEFLQTLRAETV